MSNNKFICPVCSNKVESSSTEFCPTCNWENILISENASSGLKKYYQQKLESHKELFKKKHEAENRVESLSIENKSLIKEISEAKNNIEEAKKAKNQLKKLIEENNELTLQIKSYQEKFGDSWISNQKDKKATIAIQWEMTSQLKFRFYSDEIQKIFPDEIVMLLKKAKRPTADGDFNFAFMINTSTKKSVDKTTIELTVLNDELQKGKYYLRFTNLNFNTNNILFIHKEQGNHPTFDWEKTTINI